jgi:hypothetical protein
LPHPTIRDLSTAAHAAARAASRLCVDDLVHELQYLRSGRVQCAAAPSGDGVVLADLAADAALPLREMTGDGELTQDRVERPRAQCVSGPAQFRNHAETVHGVFGGVMENADLDEAEEELAYHGEIS